MNKQILEKYKAVLAETIQEILVSLKGEKWDFQGTVFYSQKDIVQYSLSYSPTNSNEEYIITGRIERRDQKWYDLDCDIDFSVFDDATNSYIAITDHYELLPSQMLPVFNILINTKGMFNSFCNDYRDFVENNVIETIRNLIKTEYYEDLDYDEDEYSFEYNVGDYTILIERDLCESDEEFTQSEGKINVSTEDGSFELVIVDSGGEYIDDLFELSFADETIISIEDVIVRTSNSYCINHNHKLVKVDALVYIDDGYNMEQKQAFVLYCEDCDQYYISDFEYYRLCESGRICCKVVTIDEYKKISTSPGFDWADQSVLRAYGYTVNASDNLTDEERQRILSVMIENDIISIPRAINFIEWLSRRNTGRNLTAARSKWSRDIWYLQHYEPADGIIKVDKFIKKEKKTVFPKSSPDGFMNIPDGIDEELPFS